MAVPTVTFTSPVLTNPLSTFLSPVYSTTFRSPIPVNKPVNTSAPAGPTLVS